MTDAEQAQAGPAHHDETSGLVPAGRAWVERLAILIHAIHGTRSLIVTVFLLAVFSITEPAFPDDWPAWMVTLPLAVLTIIGLATLAREGIAVQQRLMRLIDDDHVRRRLAVDLLYSLTLIVLLSPPVFLAAYGVPHLSPWTGLLSPGWQQRLSAAFLFVLLWIPILHLRRTARYARDIVPQRPRHIHDTTLHARRDLLIGLQVFVVAVWLVLLWPFWNPVPWPPSVASMARVSYAVFFPAILFIRAAGHAEALYTLRGHERSQGPMALLGLHLALTLAALAMHLYGILWIVRYQALLGF